MERAIQLRRRDLPLFARQIRIRSFPGRDKRSLLGAVEKVLVS